MFGTVFQMRPKPGQEAAIVALVLYWLLSLISGTSAATLVRGNGPRRDLGLVWSWRDVAIGAGLGLAGLVLTVPASTVWAAVVGSSNADSAVRPRAKRLRFTRPGAEVVIGGYGSPCLRCGLAKLFLRG